MVLMYSYDTNVKDGRPQDITRATWTTSVSGLSLITERKPSFTITYLPQENVFLLTEVFVTITFV